MQLPSRTPPTEFELDDLLDDAIPDSTVRPTAPPSHTREAVLPSGERMLGLVIRVTPQLLGASKTGYLTVSVPEGEVLFEGELDAAGQVDLCVMIPGDVSYVEATLEAGTKYRKAKVRLTDGGPTSYTFA